MSGIQRVMASVDARSRLAPGLLLLVAALVAACQGSGVSGY